MVGKTVNRSNIQSSIVVPSEYTTIKVRSSTRDKLQELGSMKDSYDTVIERLIKNHEELKTLQKRIDAVKKKVEDKESGSSSFGSNVSGQP